MERHGENVIDCDEHHSESVTSHDEIERLRREVQRISAELENLRSKRVVGDLKVGDRYYVVNRCGDVDEIIYTDDDVDRLIAARHRAFMTQEEAEIFRDMSQSMADLIYVKTKRMEAGDG